VPLEPDVPLDPEVPEVPLSPISSIAINILSPLLTLFQPLLSIWVISNVLQPPLSV
jgi:hypothetical protein